MDYLTLTNQVLAELNEVQLTSSTFASSSGIQSTTKNIVKRLLNIIKILFHDY